MSASTGIAIQRWTQKYFRDLDEVYSDIYENRQFNGIYLTMLVMAGLIALLGLLINSPAVIIGAMLISPLMGPILSCGLALTLADWDFGKKGLRNVLFSVIEVVLITTLFASLSPLKDATSEILARSNPNLMDLLIAFFSGVAGSIALVTRSKSGLTIIPGVAIATAVMPPLATVGYGIATAQWPIARGSFMLFFTNLVAIVISADLVFFIAGFRTRLRVSEKAAPAYVRARGMIAFLILAVISVPLVRTLAKAALQARARRQVQAVLKSLEKPHDIQLGSWRFDLQPDRVVVDASLITGEPLDKNVIGQTERLLSSTLKRHAELHVSQIRVDDGRTAGARHDFLSGGNLAAIAPPPKSPEEVISEYQSLIETKLNHLARGAAFENVVVRYVGIRSDKSVGIQLAASRKTPANQETIAVIASTLAIELGRGVALDCDLHIAETKLNFRPDSALLSTASSSELKELIKMKKKYPELGSGSIAFTTSTPLNERRKQLVERSLRLPVNIRVDPSLVLTSEDGSVYFGQSIGAYSALSEQQ